MKTPVAAIDGGSKQWMDFCQYTCYKAHRASMILKASTLSISIEPTTDHARYLVLP